MKIGDIVQWTSQAAGVEKTKVGQIVAIVPANKDVTSFIPKDMSSSATGAPRDHESYLVQVGKSIQLYWPLVSKLHLVGQDLTNELVSLCGDLRLDEIEPLVPDKVRGQEKLLASFKEREKHGLPLLMQPVGLIAKFGRLYTVWGNSRLAALKTHGVKVLKENQYVMLGEYEKYPEGTVERMMVTENDARCDTSLESKINAVIGFVNSGLKTPVIAKILGVPKKVVEYCSLIRNLDMTAVRDVMNGDLDEQVPLENAVPILGFLSVVAGLPKDKQKAAIGDLGYMYGNWEQATKRVLESTKNELIPFEEFAFDHTVKEWQLPKSVDPDTLKSQDCLACASKSAKDLFGQEMCADKDCYTLKAKIAALKAIQGDSKDTPVEGFWASDGSYVTRDYVKVFGPNAGTLVKKDTEGAIPLASLDKKTFGKIVYLKKNATMPSSAKPEKKQLTEKEKEVAKSLLLDSKRALALADMMEKEIEKVDEKTALALFEEATGRNSYEFVTREVESALRRAKVTQVREEAVKTAYNIAKILKLDWNAIVIPKKEKK